jgi:hypothetical protein
MASKRFDPRFSRRSLLLGAGASGVAAATPGLVSTSRAFAAGSPAADGAPEQVHLT